MCKNVSYLVGSLELLFHVAFPRWRMSRNCRLGRLRLPTQNHGLHAACWKEAGVCDASRWNLPGTKSKALRLRHATDCVTNFGLTYPIAYLLTKGCSVAMLRSRSSRTLRPMHRVTGCAPAWVRRSATRSLGTLQARPILCPRASPARGHFATQPPSPLQTSVAGGSLRNITIECNNTKQISRQL